MSDKYILVGHTPVPCDNIHQWGNWFEKSRDLRRVARSKKGNVVVSTVFLGLDHSFVPGRVELFETLIFGGKHDQDIFRYATWEEAERGHKRVCKRLGIKP